MGILGGDICRLPYSGDFFPWKSPALYFWSKQTGTEIWGGVAFCYFAIYSYTFVFKSKGQRLVLIRNSSKTCTSELFKSQNNKEQVKRIAEKEVKEDENYFNFFLDLFLLSTSLTYREVLNQVN